MGGSCRRAGIVAAQRAWASWPVPFARFPVYVGYYMWLERDGWLGGLLAARMVGAVRDEGGMARHGLTARSLPGVCRSFAGHGDVCVKRRCGRAKQAK